MLMSTVMDVDVLVLGCSYVQVDWAFMPPA